MDVELSEMELSLLMMFRLLPGGLKETTVIMTRRSLLGCQKIEETVYEFSTNCEFDTVKIKKMGH